MSVSGKTFDTKILRRLMSYAKPYQKPFLISGLLILVLSYLGVLRADMIGNTIDESVNSGDSNLLLNMTILLVVLLVVEAILQYFQTWLANKVAQSVTIDLRKKLFAHVLRFKMTWFNNTPIGTTVTRVTSDIDTVADVFSEGMLTIIGDILKLIFVIIWMFVLNWKLTLLTLIPIPLLLIATRIFQKSIKKSFQSVRVQVAQLNAFVQEHVTGMHIVQLFGMEDTEMKKFKDINQKHNKAHIDSVMAYSIFFPVVEILAALSIAILVWYGAHESLEGNINFGETVEFLLLINMLYRPIRMLADRFNILQMGMVGAERVFNLLDSENHIEDAGTLAPKKLEGNIKFRDVHFAYKDENFVLKGVSFDVKKGEKIAFVGSTGAGKSTIVNVLTRLYEYQKGEILIDGADLRSYKQENLHQHIGVVSQDIFLFSDTVFNNITLRDPSISLEKVIEAAKQVGAHDFISKLPGSYQFEVSERGNSLSLGQRQLISFIRAYVYNPEILILDEATSSVDTESELMIQKAIEKITENRTSIIIAHRLSTIRKADKIMVMDHGSIVESGSHDELVLKNGYYKRLFDLQFK
jgi:ATP-binding cassette subfamily B multidrug efflux pump